MIQPIISRVLHTRFSSDAQLSSNVQTGSEAIPASDLSLKLHVLVYLFAAYQDAELSLQATSYKLVHLYAIHTLKLHVF